MEAIASLLFSLVDRLLAFLRLRYEKPRVTCDVRGVYKGRWYPDFWHDEKGETAAEGIRIETSMNILLANNGAVDTTIKDVYLEIRYDRKKPIHLKPDHNSPKYQGVEIGPRKIWGPHRLTFEGSLWDINKVPKDLRAHLIVEPVAQSPIRKPVKLFL